MDQMQTARIVVSDILDKVQDEKVRVTIVWEPHRTEVTVEPWEPFKMECPYTNKKSKKGE